MKRAWKFVLTGLFILSVLFGVLWFFTEGPEDWRRERAIRSLISAGASPHEVAQRLPVVFTDCSIGSPHRSGFEQFLNREPATSFVGLRERVAKYPGVWFHTTMWTMTYLFFDADGRLRDYYTCAQ